MPRRVKKAPKNIYEVIATNIFKNRVLGETWASKPEALIGRKIEISVADTTGNFTHENYKMWFKIISYDESKAYATFVKEALRADYVRSIIRRRTSRVDVFTRGETSDGHLIHYFNLIVTERRVRKSKEQAIRRIANQIMTDLIPKLTIDELVISAIFSEPYDIRRTIIREAGRITRIQLVEPLKIEVIKLPAKISEGGKIVESIAVSSG
uniref:Ribosomal protein S3AE n=1 Tax=uncultured korarchaeote TaxID=161241 RepID=A0A1L2JK95_9CREN|nr:ribosomal protein S3AE [uncultured korarchaeote]